MIEISAFDETAIHKKILITSGLFRCFGFTNEPINIQIICFLIYTHHLGIIIIAEDLDDALF